MTIGAPTRSALEVEDAMLAFGMNGEPLPSSTASRCAC